MRLLSIWAKSCAEDPSWVYRFSLSDFMSEANIKSVAERDLFPEHDPERWRRQAISEEARRRNIIKAWRQCDTGQALQ
jgi:hypothetical protein